MGSVFQRLTQAIVEHNNRHNTTTVIAAMASLFKVLGLFVLVLLAACLMMTEAAPQNRNSNGFRRNNGRRIGNRRRFRNGRNNQFGRTGRSNGLNRNGQDRDPASPFGFWSNSDQDGFSRQGRDVSHVLAAIM